MFLLTCSLVLSELDRKSLLLTYGMTYSVAKYPVITAIVKALIIAKAGLEKLFPSIAQFCIPARCQVQNV